MLTKPIVFAMMVPTGVGHRFFDGRRARRQMKNVREIAVHDQLFHVLPVGNIAAHPFDFVGHARHFEMRTLHIANIERHHFGTRQMQRARQMAADKATGSGDENALVKPEFAVTRNRFLKRATGPIIENARIHIRVNLRHGSHLRIKHN